MEAQIGSKITRELEMIKTLFDGIIEDKDRYLDNFEEWTHHRRLTLAELQKFQKELNRIHQYGNTGQVVGNGASVLGSLASIIGFGLSFSKDLKPIGNELMKYGSAVATVGGATSISASLAETGFSMKVLNEVKAALKKDWQLTKELLPWFERAEELDSALEEVFGCDWGFVISDILKIIKELRSLYVAGGESWNRIKNYLLSQANHNFSLKSLQTLDDKKLEKIVCNASYKVKLLLAEFCRNPSVRKATSEIYMRFKKNPVAFDLSKISIRTIRDVTRQQTSLVASFNLSGAFLIQGTGLALQGIFKTVSFALSVLAFVSAVEDIKEEKSKYNALIEKTKRCLKMELETLEESYPMLRR